MIIAAVISFLLGLGVGFLVWRKGHRFWRVPGGDDVLDRIHDGVIVVTSEGSIVRANSRAFVMLGLEPRGAMQRLRLALRRVPELVRFLDGLNAGPGTGRLTVEVGYPDVRHIHVQASRLAPSGGGGLLLLTLTDVTRVEELERVRRRFTADLSHELRTPVTSIRLLAETLDYSGAAPEHAGRILREAGRLEHLVEQVLALSRLESGEDEFDPGYFRLGDLIDEARDRVGSHASARGVSVVCDLDGDERWWGDVDRLLRLLEVYLENAVKYSPPDGVVTVRAGREGDHNVLGVTDLGPGIPVEEQPHIFRRFYKGRRQPETLGFGLGLAIAKHSALTHGGDVFVESHVGEGSTFGLRIPTGPEA